MVFLAFLSSLAFIFLGKSYAKKENATLKKAVLRAFLWSLVLCWSYVVLETVGMPGHVVGSMKVPWLAATFMSIAFNYTFTPGLILSPVIPIALYTLTFYAVNTESIDTKKIIISCIKSVCMIVSLYLLILFSSYKIPTISEFDLGILNSISIVFAVVFSHLLVKSNYYVVVPLTVILTIIIPFNLIIMSNHEGESAFWVMIQYWSNIDTAKKVLMMLPSVMSAITLFLLNTYNKSSNSDAANSVDS